jgi:hypothetical protein
MIAYVLLFIFGGVLGATFDGFHTHSGTDAYPHPQFLMMEWWVPPLFGAATLAIALSHLDFDRRFQREAAPRPWGDILAAFVLFGIQYFISGFLKIAPWPKTVVISAFALALWLAFEGTLSGLLMAAATALVGCLIEIALIKFGKFYYVISDIGPNVSGIPVWLPFLYVSGSVTVGNLARRVFARRPGLSHSIGSP